MHKSGLTLLAAIASTISINTAANIAQEPLFLVEQAKPRVMLAMSNDHQLSVKAYTDYSDLDADGDIDITYLDSYAYSGYFDNGKCYLYDATDGRFEPDGTASGTNGHTCNGPGDSNQWSGNFLNWATMTRMDIIRHVLYGGKRSTDSSSVTVLERAMLPDDVHAFVKTYGGSDIDDLTPYNVSNISICNLTPETTGLSGATADAPVIRVADGDYPRWAAQETVQCYWNGTAGSSEVPGTDDRLGSSDPTMRVSVCESGTEETNCVSYSGNLAKPTGILQTYGQNDSVNQMHFGLVAGSYQNNISGGILRKNILPITGNGNTDDEIDSSTGIIKYLDPSLTSAQRTSYSKGIIHTLDALRIAGWSFTSNSHQYGCSSYNNPAIANGECVDWGNPLSEIYLEALRYLSGKTTPTTAFSQLTNSKDDDDYISGLTGLSSWTDPMPSDEWCADLSVITVSTGLNSFDTDELSNDIGINADTWTDAVGTAEGVSGNYFIGENGVTDDNTCTSKSLTNLSDAKGVCPEVPALEGGYHIAGLAYYAKTNDLRSDRSSDQTVTTYGVALAESLPRFEIPVGTGSVTILPNCEADGAGTSAHTCSITDLRIISYASDSSEGEFDITWEDGTWGSDYDMDAISRISFCVGSACSPTINSDQIKVTVDARQAFAGVNLKLGYLIGGTTNDGTKLPFTRPGGTNFSYTNSPTYTDTQTYTQGSTAANLLRNPLWYTAKYGSFEDADEDATPPTPNLQSEWDADNDGDPDGYFEATNPADLFSALSSAVGDIVSRTSSASAVATNSTRLDTETRIYQARFVSGTWYGQLLAFDVDNTSGAIDEQLWDAGDLVPTSRNIFTFEDTSSAYNANNDDGVEFLWANLTSHQQGLITAGLSGAALAAGGEAAVNYLRGTRTGEGSTYRTRTKVFGDIVNSDPLFSSDEDFDYYSLEFVSSLATYDDYLNDGDAANDLVSTDKDGRQPMLYVGANDGMLHAILADGDTTGGCNPDIYACEGEEVFAYVPKAVYSNLGELTESNYVHQYFVDGSPKHGDAYIDWDGTTDRWGTALIGTLGAGGKGIFALDISDPLNFTAADVLWDLDDADLTSNGSLTDLGYTFSQPTVVKLANGDWGVVFGNGYGSASGRAMLYIVNLETGALIESIDTEVGDTSTPNGLSTPIVIDTNDDQIADTVYAGDLLGNMWAFDISAGNTGQWEVKYSTGNGNNAAPAPLFTACTGTCSGSNYQPITAKPQAVALSDGGILVLFGTGKYYETGDNTNVSQTQTYYGIQDDGATVSGRSVLQEQTILDELTAAESGLAFDTRITSTYDVDYTTQKGWFMDFDYVDPITSNATYPGERIVAASLVRNDRVIFPTLVPDTEACSFGGTSWLMELDADTGARLSITPFDLNNDGVIDANDKVRYDSDGDGDIDADDDAAYIDVSGKKSTVGIVKTPGVISTGTAEVKYTSGSTGEIEVTTESAGAGTGRQSWLQLR